MIVLDEQLLGRDIELYIAAWYAGAVLLVTDLRPNTVIKDDAIPALLRHPQLRTKAQRMGKVIHVTDNETSYYTYTDTEIKVL
jgi:hypothetical protein